ncbi:MAG TPA: periplasmic heavy metal sensor [Hyphomicrobiaceae bacterium]|jgi:Spy/CpxP family protein refolding chaperone|nr:periplasmic heavy metal sensor [Hyphomicrobiaceae bacterium]
MVRLLAMLAYLASTGLVLAQSHQPYAGLQQRDVKALSETQIADLKAGRGMGFALPAELNGYPGPAHVLENADTLSLTSAQRARTKELFEAMKAEAIPMGERLIAQETRLDRLFARHEVTPATLAAATAEIGATQGKLRAAHLKYHLAMMEVLTPEQVAAYRKLRGYTSSQPMPHHHH